MSNTDELACTYASLILHDAGVAITGRGITKLTEAANVWVTPFWPNFFENQLKGQNLDTLIMSSGAGAPSAAASGTSAPSGGDAPAPAPVVEEGSKPPSSTSTTIETLLPTLREHATKLMAKFTEHKADVDKGVDMAKKGFNYLDIHWRVELGDAEFVLLEEGGEARGTFKMASVNHGLASKNVSNIEDELVAVKMALAQADQDRMDLTNRLDAAKEEVTKAKQAGDHALAAARNDQGVLEQILITTKLKLAEAESELMSAKQTVKPAAKPAGKK